MNRDETKNIVRFIAATYPAWRPADYTEVVNAWYLQLQHDDYETLMAALALYNRQNVSGYAPSIGQLLDYATRTQKRLDGNEISESEAWAIARKAIQGSIQYDSLPPIIQRCIGSAESLRELGNTQTDSISVVESHFRRVFRIESEREIQNQINAPYMQKYRALITDCTNKLLEKNDGGNR